MTHKCPCQHEQLLGRIDERTARMEKLLTENVMPTVNETVPKLVERVSWLKMAVLGIVAILGTVQVLVAFWKP